MEVREQSKTIKKEQNKLQMRIAPTEYSHFSERQMERLIRHLLRKHPHLLRHGKHLDINPNYKLVEEKVTGPKIVPKQTISRTAAQNHIDAAFAPGPTTYQQDDRILHKKLPNQVWGAMKDTRPS